jgi:hypothetical protein
MRAQFIRGQDPNKSLGIGKYSKVWGNIEDYFREKVGQLQNMDCPFAEQFNDPEFFISNDGNSILIYFPYSDFKAMNFLFQRFSHLKIFVTIKQMIETGRSEIVGLRMMSPIEYSKYDIPISISDEKFGPGNLIEIYIN